MKRIGRYEVLEELARGGQGAVFRARDPELNREVAIKTLLASSASTTASVRRFEREARVLARLRHPHIVPVHEAGIDQGRRYLVLDYVRGRSLQARLDEQGPLPSQEAAALTERLADALALAHAEGILHRDVKPDNVLLTTDGRPLLTDFGLAKDLDSASQLSQTGRFMGTPGFWPPEQARGELAAMGPRSDVYSLGATLYAVLTGESPHPGDTLAEVLASTGRRPRPPTQLVPDVDEVLERICLRCLEKRPDDRYPDCQALATDLRRYLAGDPIARSQGRGRALVVGLIVCAGVVVIGMAAREPATPTPPRAQASTPEPALDMLGRFSAALAELEAQPRQSAALAEAEELLLAWPRHDPRPLAALSAFRPGAPRAHLVALAGLVVGEPRQALQLLRAGGEHEATEGRITELLKVAVAGARLRASTLELLAEWVSPPTPDPLQSELDQLLREIHSYAKAANRRLSSRQIRSPLREVVIACYQRDLAWIAASLPDNHAESLETPTLEHAIGLQPDGDEASLLWIAHQWVLFRHLPGIIQPLGRLPVPDASRPPLFRLLRADLHLRSTRFGDLTARSLDSACQALEAEAKLNTGRIHRHAVSRVHGNLADACLNLAWRALREGEPAPPRALARAVEHAAHFASQRRPKVLFRLVAAQLLAGQVEEARASAELLQEGLFARDQLLAEVALVEGEPAAALGLLETANVAGAFRARAHASHLLHDELATARDLERARVTEAVDLAMPWHDRRSIEKVLDGSWWWPGAP